MPDFRIRLLPGVFILLVTGLVAAGPVAARYAATAADTARGTPDEDVPYGVAAGYIVGHKLLEEGSAKEALPYLHMAYRAQPKVIDIAMDFQEALAAEGYVKDALQVMDLLITDHPDSLGFLVKRANLNLKAGKAEEALADLRRLRAEGRVDFAIIDAEASILAATGETSQALDVYRDGLELLPADGPDIYLGMVGVLQKAERLDEVPDLLEQALADHPDEPRLWLLKARVEAAQGRHDAAVATARAADTHFATLLVAGAPDPDLELDDAATGAARPAPPAGLPADSFLVELADFYAQRGQPDQALAILEPLSAAGELRLAPSLWLARLLLGTGRSEEGAALVTDILGRWPDSGRAWYLQGKVAEGAGDWEGSLPDYARAVEKAPRDAEIRIGYVRAMLVAWERDLAAAAPDTSAQTKLETFRRHVMVASTLVPDEDRGGQLVLGYAFKALRDYERAAWRFGLAAESDELRLGALLQKSICHDTRGEEEQARADLETLHREFPRNPEVANSLGYFFAEKGIELKRAAELVEIALAAEPGNGAYLDSMGWIHYRNGNFERALDFMIQAVNVLPDDPVITEHLGMVLKAQGQAGEALDMLRRALALGGDRERLQAVIAELENAAAKDRP
ncbi:tetratricopeptide repeat protein [bacterium]|nr:tetratricopeptide repeat protein [bacterium]